MPNIKQDERNYRAHPEENKEAIKKSLEDFKPGRSIVLDSEGGIIGGNGVYEQAEALGIPVEVIESDGSKLFAIKRTDISPDDPRRSGLALADNATTDLSVWVEPLLKEDFTREEIETWGIELEWEDDKPQRYEPNLTPPPETIISQLGDLYELNGHRLVCGDSTLPATLSKLMDGEKSKAVFTDPPYNIDYGHIVHPKFKNRKIDNDSMTREEFRVFTREWAERIDENNDGCVYVFGPPGADGRIIFSVLDELYHNSTTIAWVKDHFTLGRAKYHNQYEPIWFGWNSSGKRFIDDRTLANVWNFPRPYDSELHPTMKPPELIEYGLQHATKEGDEVLDFFAGSGSTLVACENIGREARLVELLPMYCDVIVRRWVEQMIEVGKDYNVRRNGEDITGDAWLTEEARPKQPPNG